MFNHGNYDTPESRKLSHSDRMTKTGREVLSLAKRAMRLTTQDGLTCKMTSPVRRESAATKAIMYAKILGKGVPKIMTKLQAKWNPNNTLRLFKTLACEQELYTTFIWAAALSKDNRRIPHTDFDIEADTKLFSSKGIIVWQTKKSIRNTPRGSIFSFNYKDIGQFQEFGKIKITNIKLVQLNKTEDWNNAYLLFYINRRHSFLD